MSDKPLVFISYSHKDEFWKELLLMHLGSLSREFDVELWDDKRIVAGEDWAAEISIAIERASIALLLISSDYLASEYILQQEIPFLLERQSRATLIVIPIIIRPCTWQSISWLTRVQVLPRDGQPLSTFDDERTDAEPADIAREVRNIVSHAKPQERSSRRKPVDPSAVVDVRPRSKDNNSPEEERHENDRDFPIETTSTATAMPPAVETPGREPESQDYESLATDKRESTYLKKLERDVATLKTEIPLLGGATLFVNPLFSGVYGPSARISARSGRLDRASGARYAPGRRGSAQNRSCGALRGPQRAKKQSEAPPRIAKTLC
ncbi:MAG: toll/interleukin-1 receptor domain-containing protein, partial [Deltaproteobacteria bacterium]|nr:toll/interleukin-1 receptor domain-containing protein [Deltaproteobacteria bacterium]